MGSVKIPACTLEKLLEINIKMQKAIFVIILGLFSNILRAEEFTPTTYEGYLPATVRITVSDDDGNKSYGSGFFLNENGSTFIYTNAHVIDAAEKITILDHSGKQVSGIEWIEAFKEPFGNHNGPSAGDGVRLKLEKYRHESFTLATDFSILDTSRNLVVFGDNDGANDGRQEIQILEGELRNKDNGIITYTCNTKQGSSGGAVVDAATKKVVALNTWGIELPENSYQRVFGIHSETSIGFGTILENPKWLRFTVKDYLAQGRAIRRFQKNLERMILLTYLVPTAHGIYANPEDEFVGGMSVADAIERHKNAPVMEDLFDLHNKLSANRNSKIKISNVDVYKSYLRTLDEILRERSAVIPTLKSDKLSFYHKHFVETRLLDQADKYFANDVIACRNWFKEKTSVGGSIPLNAWETLPPFGRKLSADVEKKFLEN